MRNIEQVDILRVHVCVVARGRLASGMTCDVIFKVNRGTAQHAVISCVLLIPNNHHDGHGEKRWENAPCKLLSFRCV